jgi:23S rRNA (guanosine2251-2'-O)-methyltransferase
MKKKVIGLSEKKELRNQRLAIGLHAVKEVLKIRPKAITKFIIKKEWASSKEHVDIVNELKRRSIPFEEKTQEQIDKLGTAHQGVACFINAAPIFELEKIKTQEQAVILVLDGVEDPHNLGAILRTAWLMGVDGLIVPQDRAVGLTPTVHKVACGAVEHVPVLFITNFTNVLNDLKENGFWIYGLSGDAKLGVYQLKLPKKIVWILGAEDKGMRNTTEKICDELVSIRQKVNAASYNVSVSAAIALAETFRQFEIKS